MEIPANRVAEHAALVELLSQHGVTPEARLVANRIALACMHDHHLWKAMHLEDRAELRELFETHFPALAEANDRDMRWKRFLYKMMCGWEGFSG